MPQRVFQVPFHVPGTLSADLNIVFTAPFDMQLVHASVVNTTTSTALLTIGTTSSAAAYLASSASGVSSVPAEYDRDDFVGGEFPHIPKGTVVKLALVYNTTTAAINWTCVLTFAEG